MASPGWFNENENRAYPFVKAATQPANHALVVDAGFVLGAKSRFESGTHRVYLRKVRRQGSLFFLDFGSDAPELFDVTLTFSRHVADGDFVSEFVDSGGVGFSTSSQSGSDSTARDVCDEPLWSGFVTTGRMAALEALLPGTGEAEFAAVVEPALVQNLAETFVVKFGLANVDRTRVQTPTGCGEDGDTDTDVVYVNAFCVLGDVVVKPGYNANVRQNPQDNSITLGASIGDGEGQPCQPVPLHAYENPPEGSSLLEGGPRCNETLRSVNGIGGPAFNFLAGRGTTVTSVPEENKIVVDVNMRGLALCVDTLSARSESC